VLLRLQPSDIGVREPHSCHPAAAWSWLSFSGVVVGARPVEPFCIRTARDEISAHSQQDVKKGCNGFFVQDLKIQHVLVHIEPLDDAFVSARNPFLHPPAERVLRRSGLAQLPDAPPAVVEVHGEQAGAFAMGDRVVGYGYMRQRSWLRPEPGATGAAAVDPNAEPTDPGDDSFEWQIQANNMVRTNSREWIVPRDDHLRIFDLRSLFQSAVVQLLGVQGANHVANGALVAGWLLTSIMIDFAFSESTSPQLRLCWFCCH
jgi:hypothetical protein